MSGTTEKLTTADSFREFLKDDLHVKASWDGRQIDGLLQWMIAEINRHHGQQAVTLTVGGNLISGFLISADQYFEQIAAQLASGYNRENGSADKVRQTLLAMKPKSDDPNDVLPPPQFVHLMNAEVFTQGGHPILAGGSLWRGKVSSVDGFNLGNLVVR